MKGPDVPQTRTAAEPGTPEEAAARLRELRPRIEEQTADLAEMSNERLNLIRYLAGQGWSYRIIGEAAGITGQRVGAVLKPAPPSGRGPGRPPKDVNGG